MKIALFLLASVSCFAQKPQKLKALPQKDLAMTCHFDQYRITKMGVIEYTYMRCEDRAGDFSQWMRVPDHQVSAPGDHIDTPAAALQTTPVQAPQSAPAAEEQSLHSDDDDSATHAETKGPPKI